MAESATGDQIDELFLAHPDLMSVVVSNGESPERLGTISRLDFYRELAGRLGFGHALHSHRPVRDMTAWEPMELSAAMSVDQATALVLQRGDRRYDDVLVRWPDGALGTASAPNLFEALAGLYGHHAMHDPLTGLPNRTLLSDRVQHALDGRAREAVSLALLFIDIDDFKTVNDSLGHQVGDRLLVKFGERLKLIARPSDTLARLGGDEFALLLPGMRRVDQAEAVAVRISESLHLPFEIDGEVIHVGASVGVAFVDGDIETAEAVLRDADLAMYSAKRGGKGGHEVFQPVMHRRVTERRHLETELRQAIDRDELFLEYQPQLSIASNTCVGLEALVRWNHPARGILLPDSFIAVAEETGLVVELDTWVLRHACLQARLWALRGSQALRVAVNVSGRNFESRRLVKVVRDALEESRLDPDRLELEVTESVAVRPGGLAEDTLRQIRRLGARVAMDDFGTGHSALHRLVNFPLDTVKIDQSFVARIDEGARECALVGGIIDMCHALGLDVVAEGVETPNQLAYLRQAGCDSVQGFLLGRPAAADSIEMVLLAAESGGRLTA